MTTVTFSDGVPRHELAQVGIVDRHDRVGKRRRQPL